MRTLSISGILIVFTIAIALWAQDAIPRTQVIPSARRTIQTTDGQTLQGQVLSEGMSDLQLRADDRKIRLFRTAGDRYRAAHNMPEAGQSPNQYALFDCVIEPETGDYLSEDYTFCHRWRAIGGDLGDCRWWTPPDPGPLRAALP